MINVIERRYLLIQLKNFYLNFLVSKGIKLKGLYLLLLGLWKFMRKRIRFVRSLLRYLRIWLKSPSFKNIISLENSWMSVWLHLKRNNLCHQMKLKRYSINSSLNKVQI